MPPNEDVIRSAFIYKVGKVSPVGASQILADPAFANARQPLAQRFQPESSKRTFVAVVNHFKSKGSGEDDGTDQGKSNPSRVAQAKALTGWVNKTFADDPVFMLGDFNAYAMEDPIRAMKTSGFSEVVEEHDPDAASYEFSGRVGSLDHIFANAKAHELVSGAGIWDINGSESVAMQYSRRDDIVADLHHQPVRCIGTLASPGGLLYADSGPQPSIDGVLDSGGDLGSRFGRPEHGCRGPDFRTRVRISATPATYRSLIRLLLASLPS